MMQRALTFAACAALSGCLVGPDYKRPDFYAPPTYSTDFEISQTGDRLWWRGFRDPALDAVVEKALAENQQIVAALDRLEAVNANVRATQADLFPRFDGTVSREERLFVTDPANPGQPGSGDPQEAGDTTTRIDGISRLVFSPDFFGRTRRSVEFARANRRAQIFAILDLRRAIASGVASRYIDLRRIDARTRLLEQSLELQLQTLEIVRKRRSAGLAADLDVRRAEADLARTRAQQGALMNARARAAFDLAVLLGEAPSAASDLPGRSTIPRYIAGPPIGVPAELIRRRPDVQQTEAFLIAATAEIGIETADLYPSLRIPGSVTLDLGGTIDRTELVGTISSVIDIPLFDAGRRRAEIRGAKARARAAVSDYEQSVLSALADVEIALVGINAAELQLREFQSAVESSEYAFDQLTALYREGLATFIDILDAQRTLIANREAYVDAEAAAAISVVDLYFAVGSPTGTPETEAARLSRPARKSLFRAIEALEQPSETESTPEATGHNGTGAPLNQSN